nr:hypothetical protein CFP56_58268 [Quercus suber]
MDIIVMKEGDQSRNAMEEAGGMEVELTAETEEAKRRQHETKIMPKNPGTSMSVGILGSLTKTEDTKSVGDSFEFKGGKIDGMKAQASGDTKGLGPSLKEEVMVGSTMGFGTYVKTEIDSSNTGPLKDNRRHNHSGDFSGDGVEGKENDGFSPKSMKGTWKRLNREATTTMAMEGGSMEEGPKRKLLPPLGETDPNRLQDKRAKIDIDEVALGMVQGIAVPSVGRSGGLGLLWKSNLKVLVKFINRWYIDALIDSGSEVGIWRLTGFYENPETHKRIDSWEVLTRLGQRLNKPWVCIGDFNEVLSVNEKEGRAEISSRQIMNFRQCLDSNGLRDLGFTGSWFTWAVDRRDYGCIQARLDRAMATTEWSGIFPWGRLYHRANSASDHCILLLKLEQNTRQKKR